VSKYKAYRSVYAIDEEHYPVPVEEKSLQRMEDLFSAGTDTSPGVSNKYQRQPAEYQIIIK